MGLRDVLVNLVGGEKRSHMQLDEWANYYNSWGGMYTPPVTQTLVGGEDRPNGSFSSWTQSTYKSNAIVFACMAVRLRVFSQATFIWRQRRKGQPGDLFSMPGDLDMLRHPWPNGHTQDLLSKAIQDVDLAGNFFAVRRPGRIKRLRPDWVTIVMGSFSDRNIHPWDADAEVLGYIYQPGGQGAGQEPVVYSVDEVAHWAPYPDPVSPFRGMSWTTPILREVLADGAATTHKLKFFENGATPNMVVSLDANVQKEAFDRWVATFDAKHTGALNAYKTLYLGGGAKVEVVGRDMAQIDFKSTQGAGETRIAAAAGVPPVIVGLSEGLQGSSLNSGNYESAKRLFADITMQHLWQTMVHAMASIITEPEGAELWYDDRIPFLDDDKKDLADIQGVRTEAINRLLVAGYKPDAVVDAVMSDDLRRLQGEHSGLFSVQLQEPGANKPDVSIEPVPQPLLTAGRSTGLRDVNCQTCGRLVGRAEGAAELWCRHCKAATVVEGGVRAEPDALRELILALPTAFASGKSDAPVINFNEGAFRAGDVHVPAVEAPVITVEAPKTSTVRRDVDRDEHGRIRSVRETVEA